jgi:hypothetical protein
MNDTAKQYQVRLYAKHRSIIKKGSRKLKISDAEIVRRALEAFTY